MNKKLLCLSLALLLALSVLVSCASSPEEETGPAAEPSSNAAVPGEEEAETESSLALDDLGEADFGGDAYIIAGLSNRTTTAVTSSELNGEVINDAQYNSARTVEDRFNVAISYEDIATDDGGMATAIRNIVSSGEENYSVTFSQDTNAITLATSGHFHNLKSIPEFNFDQPWWIDSTTTIGVGDKCYVASSYLSYYCLYYMRVFVINKGIAADLGIEVPYQKVYEGNWYLDDIIEMAEKATLDLDGDGKMTAKDRYGLTYEVFYTLQNSLGVPVISKDENNMPYISFDVERAALYLEKMEDLTENYGYLESNYGANMFADGLSLMCYCNLREVCNIIRDTDLSYGFIPAPKLDENQKEYITSATDAYWCVPTSAAARADMIGTVTEALSCQHYNLVRPAFYETTMKGKLADAPEDTAVLNMIPATMSIDFGYAYYQVITAMPTLRDLTNTTTSGKLASTYKKLSAALEKQLAATVEKYENLE